MFSFVTVEAFPAIPTLFSLVPVIIPLFVNIEVASPNIPVENFVPNIIFPVATFIPVEAFRAIPTRPSSILDGIAVLVSIVPAFVTVDPAAPNIPVEVTPFKVIVLPLAFVAVESLTAIPTALFFFPSIVPLFVNVDLATPFIPVECAVSKIILPLFVPVEAFSDIPTKPSEEPDGVAVLVSILPVLLTTELLFPIIPTVLLALKTIPSVPDPLFVIVDFSPKIPAEPSLLTLIILVFFTTDLVFAAPLFWANIPTEPFCSTLIVPLFSAVNIPVPPSTKLYIAADSLGAVPVGDSKAIIPVLVTFLSVFPDILA